MMRVEPHGLLDGLEAFRRPAGKDQGVCQSGQGDGIFAVQRDGLLRFDDGLAGESPFRLAGTLTSAATMRRP